MSDALSDLIDATPAAEPDALSALIDATPAKAKPGKIEALLRGWKQGGPFDFGDELVGLTGAPILRAALGQIAKGGVRLTPQAEAEAKAHGIELPPEQKVPSTAELYTAVRDADRAADDAAREAEPTAYIGGNIGSGIASAKLLPLSLAGPAAEGAPLLSRMGRGALNAGPAGLLYGLGSTKADLLNPYAPSLPTAENLKRAAKDIGVSTLFASGLGFGIPGAGELISKAPGAARSAGLALARKVLTGGKSSNVELPDEAVEQALKNRIVQWFGTTKGAAKRSETLSDKLDDAYQGVAQGMEAKGFQGPEGSEFADPLLKRGREISSETWNSPIPERFQKASEDALAKAGETGRYTLGRAMRTVRNLQKAAKWSPALDNPTNDANKDIAGLAREALEGSLERQTAAATDPAMQELGQQFLPAKQALKLSLRTQEALEKASRGGGSHPLSLWDLGVGTMASGHGAMGHGLTGLAYGLPVAVGSHLVRTRGPSTLAQGLWNLGRAGQWLPQQKLIQALRAPIGALSQPRGAYGSFADELAPSTPMPALANDDEEQRRLKMLALSQAIGAN